MSTVDSFSARSTLEVGSRSYEIFRLSAVEGVERLPYSLKVLLENLLRTEDGANVTADDISALAAAGTRRPSRTPRSRSRRPAWSCRTSPACRASSTSPRCARRSPRSAATPRRSTRCRRSSWSSTTRWSIDVVRPPRRVRAQRRARVRAQPRALRVPALGPDGVRQLQRRAAGHRHRAPGQPRVPGARRHDSRGRDDGVTRRTPTRCVGTDSHTTMVNGLGVLGWGVGGIEAEAAMLGQPVSMLIPQVVGFKLTGTLRRGRDRHRPRAHDHRDAAQARRGRQVRRVLRRRPRRACRSPTARRSATCARSTARPRRSSRSTAMTLDYLRLTGRTAEQVALVEAYAKAQGLWHDPAPTTPSRSTPSTSSSTSSTVVPTLAGPKRPQDRVALLAKAALRSATSPTSAPPEVATTRSTRPTGESFPAVGDAPTRSARSTAVARAAGVDERRAATTYDITLDTARSSSPRSRAAPTRRTRR